MSPVAKRVLWGVVTAAGLACAGFLVGGGYLAPLVIPPEDDGMGGAIRMMQFAIAGAALGAALGAVAAWRVRERWLTPMAISTLVVAGGLALLIL